MRAPSRTALPSRPAPSRFEAGARRLLGVAASHWPEYLMEAAELGAFMLSASLFGALLEHPASPARALVLAPEVRRVLMGLAMGGTALAIVHSRLGKRSGAHFNPAVTMSFWRLGRVRGVDAAFYALAHFGGAIAGMLLASALLGRVLAHPDVNHVRTLPGPGGAWPAIAAEVGMTFVLMSVVLEVSSRPRIARFTGLSAASLVALYIPLFAPVSGMSMNPARSAGSAAAAGSLEFLWIYFVAPLAGMLLAAEAHRFRIRRGRASPGCAKLDHDDAERCIFCGADPAFGGDPSNPRG